MAGWIGRIGITRETLMESLRAAVATVISMLVARELHLSEFFWAPVSTIVVILSPKDRLTVAWQRFVGTAVGVVLGALIATYFSFNWMIYGAGIFVCGIVSAVLRLGTAYRFAAIAMSIVVLIAHRISPWIVAAHRFAEVSLGIAVALAISALWKIPEDAA